MAVSAKSRPRSRWLHKWLMCLGSGEDGAEEADKEDYAPHQSKAPPSAACMQKLPIDANPWDPVSTTCSQELTASICFQAKATSDQELCPACAQYDNVRPAGQEANTKPHGSHMHVPGVSLQTVSDSRRCSGLSRSSARCDSGDGSDPTSGVGWVHAPAASRLADRLRAPVAIRSSCTSGSTGVPDAAFTAVQPKPPLSAESATSPLRSAGGASASTPQARGASNSATAQAPPSASALQCAGIAVSPQAPLHVTTGSSSSDNSGANGSDGSSGMCADSTAPHADCLGVTPRQHYSTRCSMPALLPGNSVERLGQDAGLTTAGSSVSAPAGSTRTSGESQTPVNGLSLTRDASVTGREVCSASVAAAATPRASAAAIPGHAVPFCSTARYGIYASLVAERRIRAVAAHMQPQMLELHHPVLSATAAASAVATMRMTVTARFETLAVAAVPGGTTVPTSSAAPTAVATLQTAEAAAPAACARAPSNAAHSPVPDSNAAPAPVSPSDPSVAKLVQLPALSCTRHSANEPLTPIPTTCAEPALASRLSAPAATLPLPYEPAASTTTDHLQSHALQMSSCMPVPPAEASFQMPSLSLPADHPATPAFSFHTFHASALQSAPATLRVQSQHATPSAAPMAGVGVAARTCAHLRVARSFDCPGSKTATAVYSWCAGDSGDLPVCAACRASRSVRQVPGRLLALSEDAGILPDARMSLRVESLRQKLRAQATEHKAAMRQQGKGTAASGGDSLGLLPLTHYPYPLVRPSLNKTMSTGCVSQVALGSGNLPRLLSPQSLLAAAPGSLYTGGVGAEEYEEQEEERNRHESTLSYLHMLSQSNTSFCMRLRRSNTTTHMVTIAHTSPASGKNFRTGSMAAGSTHRNILGGLPDER